ncbi:hypothetical protein AURDEDRAFT_167735 [Auricularia subglabra TFB-10046 SS5]|nr:hypothetical protein AURDEDRAFT_167735 [Auricularia subglabra TFB-10046 SS5]
MTQMERPPQPIANLRNDTKQKQQGSSVAKSPQRSTCPANLSPTNLIGSLFRHYGRFFPPEPSPLPQAILSTLNSRHSIPGTTLNQDIITRLRSSADNSQHREDTFLLLRVGALKPQLLPPTAFSVVLYPMDNRLAQQQYYPGCHKAFERQGHLDTHMNSHTNTRPYKCHICHADFTASSNYKRHMRDQHGMAA